jgi:two-component system sensor histidine kinase AlgZ
MPRSDAKGADRTTSGRATDFFLPDFCATMPVLAVFVTGEMLAIILVLGAERPATSYWPSLGLTSLLVQWIGLNSALLLCMSRAQLARLPMPLALLGSFLIPLTVAALVLEAAYWLNQAYRLVVTTDISHASFLWRHLGIAGLVSFITLRYLYLQHQWQHQQQVAAEARILALQARIRPHFLFNSMNSIASLIGSNSQQAENAVENLARLYRKTLATAAEQSTLGDEVDLAQDYLAIEQLRFEERLRVSWSIDPSLLDARLPPLILQPLVENAIYHGIERLNEGGEIIIRAQPAADRRNGIWVLLSVINPQPANRAASAGAGSALANIEERLDLFFQGQARIEPSRSDGLFQIQVNFPYRRAAP